MAFDTYMRIDDGSVVAGESIATGLTGNGWFEIFSFSWGASNPVTIGTSSGGMGAGKVSVSSFNIMKKSDNASPVLFQSCCQGQHFVKATVELRKAGGKDTKQGTFITYTFEEVMVESVQWSGSSGGDDTPTESVTFAFGKVKIQYMKQDKSGALSTGANASWDLTTASVEA